MSAKIRQELRSAIESTVKKARAAGKIKNPNFNTDTAYEVALKVMNQIRFYDDVAVKAHQSELRWIEGVKSICMKYFRSLPKKVASKECTTTKALNRMYGSDGWDERDREDFEG